MKFTTNMLALFAALSVPLVTAVAARADAGHDGAATAYGKPGQPGDVDRTIELTVDGMTYGTDGMSVSKGQTIRFLITNPSEIEHDFTIGDEATQKAHRADMMEMMASSSGMKGHDDPNAAFLAPGATRELVWTFTKQGTFVFACNVPGHYEAGMHGVIDVGQAEG